MNFFKKVLLFPKFIKANFKLKQFSKQKNFDETHTPKEEVQNFIKIYIECVLMWTSYDFSIEGTEKLKGLTKTVIMSNHKSNVDPFAVQYYLPFIPGWFAKKSLFENKIFEHFGIASNAYPLDRGNAVQTAIQFLKATRDFKAGRILCVFPEATRSKTEEMMPFKIPIFDFVFKLKADILPIKLSYRKNKRNSDGTKNKKFIVKILDVVKYEDYKDYDLKKISQMIFNIINKA